MVCIHLASNTQNYSTVQDAEDTLRTFPRHSHDTENTENTPGSHQNHTKTRLPSPQAAQSPHQAALSTLVQLYATPQNSASQPLLNPSCLAIGASENIVFSVFSPYQISAKRGSWTILQRPTVPTTHISPTELTKSILRSTESTTEQNTRRPRPLVNK